VEARPEQRLTWLLASGRPNALRDAVAGEPSRLAPYHRLDAAIQYERRIAGVDVQARTAVFNLYDRDNARYRRLATPGSQRFLPPGTPTQFDGVDVYDLGFQPSFRLAASW